MSLRRNFEIDSIDGTEGTKIKQYFHPHNTSNGIKYSLAQFTLGPGKKSKLHKIDSSEIYYILKGNGSLNVDENKYDMEKNDSAYVPPNSKQFIENSGKNDLEFLCIVESAWKTDSEILLE